MSAPRFDLVVFDCDGVLIDSETISCRVDAEVLREYGVAIDADEIGRRFVGMSLKTQLATLAAERGAAFPDDLPEIILRRTAAAFERELQPMPGVHEMLDAVAGPRCIASSSLPARLEHTLGLVGLYERFRPNVFSSAHVACGKPAPDLFLFAAECMGAAPARCLAIEDSTVGVSAAVAAGMTPFGFVGGGHCGPGLAERLRAAGAALVFDDLRHLPDLIAGD